MVVGVFRFPGLAAAQPGTITMHPRSGPETRPDAGARDPELRRREQARLGWLPAEVLLRLPDLGEVQDEAW